MSQFPRFHPDDIAELGRIISAELREELRQLHTKEDIINNNITFTLKDAAKILNKHPQTVSSYIEKGLIKANKSGKDWLITQQSLNNYINGNTI